MIFHQIDQDFVVLGANIPLIIRKQRADRVPGLGRHVIHNHDKADQDSPAACRARQVPTNALLYAV